MSEELDPEVEEAIAALRVAYVRELGPKLEEVAQAIASLRGARGAAAELQLAYRLAHRLYGSAGAYGLGDVAAPLGVIEAQLYSAVEAELVTDEVWWSAVDAALAAALRAGRARCAEP